jgi:hypothetical protein
MRFAYFAASRSSYTCRWERLKWTLSRRMQRSQEFPQPRLRKTQEAFGLVRPECPAPLPPTPHGPSMCHSEGGFRRGICFFFPRSNVRARFQPCRNASLSRSLAGGSFSSHGDCVHFLSVGGWVWICAGWSCRPASNRPFDQLPWRTPCSTPFHEMSAAAPHPARPTANPAPDSDAAAAISNKLADPSPHTSLNPCFFMSLPVSVYTTA